MKLHKTSAILLTICTPAIVYGVATNTWINGKTDWNSAASYIENRVPNPGDVVVVGEGGAAVSNSDADSFDVVASLGAIDIANDATMTFDVSGVATVKCAVCGHAVDNKGKITRSGGTLVKTGAGTLVFSVDANTIEPNYLMMNGALEVRSGVLKTPANYTSGYCNIGMLAISNGATFFTAGGHSSVRTYLNAIAGAGCVTNEMSAQANFQITERATSSFYGSVDGNIKLGRPYGRTDLFGVNSLCNFAFTHQNGSLGVMKFGMAGEPSSVGVGSSLELAGPGGFVSLGSGVPAETSDKDFRITTTGTVYLDCGTNASLTLTGSIKVDSSDVAQRVFELRGESNSCATVAGKVEDKIVSGTRCPVYFVKKGLGAWRFADTADVETDRAWSGGLTVENGTLLFDSLEESGTVCSLGVATNLYSSSVSTLAGAEHEDYAFSLGADGTEGTLALNGDGGNAVWCTTRPAVMNGDARFVNDTARRFRFAGISGVGTGLRTLTLDGTGTVENVVANVSDGETGCMVSLVKKGAGTWYLDGSNSFTGSLSVRAGTLVVRNPANYGWLRWTLRANYGDDFVQAYEFGVYDVDGKRLNSGTTAVSDFAAIAPGQAAYQNRFTYYENSYDLSRLFGGETSSTSGTLWMSVRYKNGNTGSRIKLNEDNPATYMPIVMRLSADAGRIDSYDILHRKSTREFKSYLLEGSVDGIHWDVLTNAVDVAQSTKGASYSVWVSNDAYYNAADATSHLGMKIPGGPAVVRDALAGVGAVSVASNATLRAQGFATISELTVDASGAGTIDGFAFAESGRLNLSGFGSFGTATVLPGTYVNATDLENVENWMVDYGDGKSHPQKVKVAGNGLVVVPVGFRMIVR